MHDGARKVALLALCDDSLALGPVAPPVALLAVARAVGREAAAAALEAAALGDAADHAVGPCAHDVEHERARLGQALERRRLHARVVGPRCLRLLLGELRAPQRQLRGRRRVVRVDQRAVARVVVVAVRRRGRGRGLRVGARACSGARLRGARPSLLLELALLRGPATLCSSAFKVALLASCVPRVGLDSAAPPVHGVLACRCNCE